jgi:hypothetical protein
MDICALSDKVGWEVMPWKWDGAPLEWIQWIAMYIRVRDASRQEQKPMTQEQLAPFAMSYEESEAYLKQIGMIP